MVSHADIESKEMIQRLMDDGTFDDIRKQVGLEHMFEPSLSLSRSRHLALFSRHNNSSAPFIYLQVVENLKSSVSERFGLRYCTVLHK